MKVSIIKGNDRREVDALDVLERDVKLPDKRSSSFVNLPKEYKNKKAIIVIKKDWRRKKWMQQKYLQYLQHY